MRKEWEGLDNILGTVRQNLNNLARIRVVNRQLDVLIAFPDVHERHQRRCDHGRVVVLEQPIETFNQADGTLLAGAPFDKVPIVIVELGYAEGGRLADVGVVVAEQDTQRLDGGLDKLRDMDIRHCAQGEGADEGTGVFHVLGREGGLADGE